MFQDGIVAQAADEIAAAGVSYFSSAGNRPASQGYDADFRFVSPGPGATQGTNIFADGSSAQGSFSNTIGPGYSFLDGFGFVNAEAAVNAVQRMAPGSKGGK